MKTGANVLLSLQKLPQYIANDIVITKSGDWLQNGVVKQPEQVLKSVDSVFLALHGAYGEDGEVQKILQRQNIPFTGSRSLPSAVAFNKHLTKKVLENKGITMPQHRVIRNEEIALVPELVAEILHSFGPEYIIKPHASGSSVGITLVKDGKTLEKAVMQALLTTPQIIVEQFIRGREATCGLLENYRDESRYTFPAVEIIPPPEAEFFSTEYKYNGRTQEICPANFSYAERLKIAENTALVHDVLGLSQYSRSDFIIKDGQVYFLEVNTLPGLTEESLYPKAAAAVGLPFEELVQFLLETATT